MTGFITDARRRLCICLFAMMSIFSFSCSSAPTEIRTRIALAGSGTDSVYVIDKVSQKVVMVIALPERDAECNSVEVDKNESVLFSYRRGARLVSKHGNVVWDMVRENEAEEVQTASVIGNGQYLLGVCGHPSKLIEVNVDGNKTKIIKFETKIDNTHNQFRQVKKAKNGNYLVPLMGRNETLEIDGNGDVVKIYPVGGFSVVELIGGNLMISTGGKIVEISRESGDVVTQLNVPKGSFITEANFLPNGNLLVSNWQGHNVETAQLEWMLVEIDNKGMGAVVWEFKDNSRIKNVSALHQYDAVLDQ